MSITCPSKEDAQAASEVLASAGARRVLLFGSVARGDQHKNSDIDLGVVFDDIDYSQRASLKHDLERQIYDATGFVCDLLVSDLAEWEQRVMRVPTSPEATVEQHGMLLWDSPSPHQVNYYKEMVLPMSRRAEAEARLVDAHTAAEY